MHRCHCIESALLPWRITLDSLRDGRRGAPVPLTPPAIVSARLRLRPPPRRGSIFDLDRAEIRSYIDQLVAQGLDREQLRPCSPPLSRNPGLSTP
jgi:hypothetical protein